MPSRCPHLRLAEARDDALVEASADHHCYARVPSERVGLGYQTRTCLTQEYQRCPRAHTAGQALAPRLVVPSPSRRHRLSLTEVAVLVMAVAITLALLFVGTAFVYRVVRGPEIRAALPIAQEKMSSIAEARPLDVSSPSLPASTPLPAPAGTLVAPVTSPTPGPRPAIPTATVSVREPATAPPSRLVIAKIALDIPVQPVGVKTIREGRQPRLVWDDVPDAGAFHQVSALPGNVGNTVINGHRDIQGAVFRHLDRVDVGDEIVVYVGDVAYPYVASEVLVVPEVFASAEQKAQNLQLIGYMPEERLTLVTCTPVGLATHRLLVIAKPAALPARPVPDAASDSAP